MKRKFIAFAAAAVACAFGCAFGMVGCGSGDDVTGLYLAMPGETPSDSQVEIDVTYGETPDLGFDLYVEKANGEKTKIALNDSKLATDYSYVGHVGSGVPLSSLPDKFNCGYYAITYVYDGKARADVSIHVAQAKSNSFSVTLETDKWFVADKTPAATVKNPRGEIVSQRNDEESLNIDDSNGSIAFYGITKDAYLAFTEAQKYDYDYIHTYYEQGGEGIWSYAADNEETRAVGEYLLLATIRETYNYTKSVTTPKTINIKDTFIDRTFTFQNMTLVDAEGNVITDEDNEYALMADDLTASNQGKTVVCRDNGEVRGTVDLGSGVFDELNSDEVFKYSAYGTNFTLLSGEQNFGSGKLDGKTLTISIPADETYHWVITLTCA